MAEWRSCLGLYLQRRWLTCGKMNDLESCYSSKPMMAMESFKAFGYRSTQALVYSTH